ncbi:putative poly(glycerol-phosphate) alpha-glucosyltransferase [Arthrobacter saudimassiliensis]|uniref:Putative poly(Glycerol-phosphate) alpha-glucosyltransferase n=1 Tax=Arthrobacter saudimassiliensis TaxID=1461584 RepID=A0A078MQA3_9MICC|nr:putative poly(glycerol-phosphate) alpha-glucosyltransferase [Arthrobacter saudimassiliensis]
MQRCVLPVDPASLILLGNGRRRAALTALENGARVIYAEHNNQLSKQHRYGERSARKRQTCWSICPTPCASLAESMAAGCVPVAYDIKYGPREMIRNGVNGFLVEHANETELADALVLVLTDLEYLDRLSVQGRKITARFSRRRFIEDWKAVLSR